MTHLLIIGLGGAGMVIAPQVHEHLGGRLVGVNTDTGTLLTKNYDHTLLIGPTTCAGEPALDPERGRLAALESREELENLIKDASRIVLVAGLGGGTGTGAALVIVEIACSLGIEVLVVALLPASFEGNRRKKLALAPLEELKESRATILIHDNEATYQGLTNKHVSLANFFALCKDQVTAKVIRLSQAT